MSHTTANAEIANSKLSMDTSFMSDPATGRIERSFDSGVRTQPIQLEALSCFKACVARPD
eukprot:5694653-Amphidinium_carterae.1